MKRACGAALALVAGWLAACGGSPSQRGAQYLVSGKAHLAKRDYARAILDLRNAVRILNRNAEPYYQLGLAYASSGDRGTAITFLVKATELDPKYLAAQVKLAGLMASSGNKEVLLGAIDRAQRVLKISPGNAEALHALATAELHLGKPRDAVAHLQEALRTMPQHLKSSVSLAQIKLSERDFAGAEAVLRSAAEQAPSSVEAAIALGRVCLFLHKTEDGEQQLRRALQLDPNSGPALLDLATERARRGDPAEAEALYKRVAALPEPETKWAYADYLLESGRQQAAIGEYERLARAEPRSREARTKLVRAYFITHRMAEAETVLNRALQQNPRESEALEQRGELFLAAGKVREAQRDLRQVLRDRPDSPALRYWLAKTYQAAGAIFSYQQELGEVLRLDSSLLRARIEFSQALRALDGARSALALMNDAPEEQRDSLPAIVERNWALLDLGEEDEARKGIEQGLKLGRDPELLVQDARLKVEQKQFAAARAVVTEVLAKEPDNVRAVEVLASSYMAEGQTGMSIEKVKECAAREPKSARLQLFSGEWLEALGQYQEARAAFLAAKAVEPGSPAADLALARLDVRRGNPAGARETLAHLVRESDNAAAHLLLGYLDDSSGKAADAVDHYKRALEWDPDNTVALNNLAFLLTSRANQLDEAIRYAERARALAPESAAVSDTIGWAFYQKGIYQTSVKYLESANTKEPTAGRMYHLAMAYHKSGRRDEAQRTFRAALKMNAVLPEADQAKRILSQP